MKDPNRHSDYDLWANERIKDLLGDQERFERPDDYNVFEEQQIYEDSPYYYDEPQDDFPFDLDVLQ
jgi:hypothetical protein